MADFTLRECAERIAKLSQSGPITEDAAVEVLTLFSEHLSAAMVPLVESLNRMKSQDAGWRFSLPGGMEGRVVFSSEPERRHIEAFKKVFIAMAETWLETEA